MGVQAHRTGGRNKSDLEHTRDLEREFERLYLESYSIVYGWVRVRMASDAEAEDIVADAFLRAARAFPTFDPARAKFSTWVTTIARNCMITHFRRSRPTSPLENVPEHALAVEGGQGETDDLLLVKQLLACLDDEERELVALKYRQGFRNVDIAEQLGVNASTVATKLARALEKMRARAEQLGGI